MEPPRFSLDYCAVSAFRTHAARLLRTSTSKGRAIVLTQHGKLAAVVLPIAMYEAILDEMTLLRDVRAAEAELEHGDGLPNLDLRQLLLDGSGR